MEALRHKPVGFWLLSDVAPFQDYSGYSRTGTLTGTETHGIALASDAVYSQVFNNILTATFPSPIYAAGRESSPFSLSATIYSGTRAEGRASQTYRENLCSRPSFEGYVDTMAGAGVGTATLDSTKKVFGTSSTKFVWTSGSKGLNVTQGFTLCSPSTTYTISFFVYVESGQLPTFNFQNESYGITDIVYGNGFYTSTVVGSWQRLYRTFTTGPAQTSFYAYNVQNSASTYYLDGVLVEQTDELRSYFDGSTPGCEWTGTSGDSTSRTRTSVSRVNLATNPNFEISPGAWTNGAYSNVTHDSSLYRKGTKSTRATRVDSLSSPPTLASVYSIGFGNANIMTGITPGETYTFSVNARPGIGGGAYTGYANFYFYTIDGLGHSSATGTPVSLITSWENKLTVTATIPEGAFGLRTGTQVYATTGDAVVGHFVNFDSATLEKSGTIGEHFDGSSVGSAWAGAANGSESYLFVSNGPQQILSSLNRYDGLTINGSEISFSTKYISTGEAKATYDIGIAQKVDVVGVHTSAKNSLFVNGKLVAEVDITPQQQLDTYASLDSNLYSGKTESAQFILANSFGAFSRALQSEQIASLYRANNRRPEGVPSKALGGDVLSLGAAARPAYLTSKWTGKEDWSSATLDNVSVDGEQVVCEKKDGLTIGGTWTDTIDLYSGETPAAINSINIRWSGRNVVVETSVDGGTTWTTATSGRNLSSISTGFDPTDKSLMIRATLASGVDEAFIDDLFITGYLTNTTVSSNRTITYNNPVVPQADVTPGLLREDAGVRISGGSVVIGPDTSDPVSNFKTLELWVKPNTTITIAGTIGTPIVYSNGQLSSAMPANEWTMLQYVYSADQTGTITISGDGIINNVVLYETELSASQALSVYNNYTGYDKFVQEDLSPIYLTETVPPVVVYSHDWAITAT